VFWALAIGFVCFVLLALLMGWILDPNRRSDGRRNGH
jgi:hypothetical protein